MQQVTHPARSRFARCSFLVLVSLISLCSPAHPASSQGAPRALLAEFERAYEARDVAAYGAVLSADFRFYFGDEENRTRRPDGWAREDELASADHLFHGFVDRTGIARPAAEAIAIDLGSVTIACDPEHPDDSARYALATANEVSLVIDFGAAGRDVAVGRHLFWLVRGDAAQLDANQAGETERWYIRRWIENPDAVLLASVVCTPVPEPVAAAPASGEPARPWIVTPNPSRAQERASLAYYVPAGGAFVEADVYDVSGRRVTLILRESRAGGMHAIEWSGADERGRQVAAGVYFLRLRIAGQTRIVRVVRMD